MRWLDREGVLHKLMAFALVSGLGLALDVGLFLSLTGAGLRAGFANLLSAFAAVTFVYFVSVRRIFLYGGRFLLPLFGLYLAYQALAIALASWAVDWIVMNGVPPLMAKLLILPATFSANYAFMAYLAKAKTTEGS